MSGLRETYVRLGMRDEASNVLRDVNRLMNQVVNNFQLLGSNINTSTSGFNSMSQEVIRLNRRLDTSTTEINSLRIELSQSSQEMANLRTLVSRLESELNDARLEIQQMQNGMQGVNKQAKQASGTFSNIGTTVAGIVTSLGAVAFGATLVSDALELDAAFGRLEARTGTTGKELAALEGVARDVFVSGFSESIGQVSDDISILQGQFNDLSDQQLSGLAKGIYTITGSWDQDFNEVSRTVSILTKNFEGLGSTQALDGITYGFQNGLDFSGELLDTLREYAPQFNEMGIGFGNMINTLEAAKDAGAWNLDKIGDSIKESHLRMGALDKATVEAYKSLGFGADEYVSKISKGGEEGNKAFQEIVGALMEVEDATLRNQLSTDLFGTQYEDLQEKVIFAMAEATAATADFEGATQKATDSLMNRFGPRMQGAWRDLKLSMVEAFQNEQMQNFIGKLADDVEAALPSIKAGFASFADTISNNIGPAYENLKTGFAWLKDNGPTIGAVVLGIASGFAAFKVITTVTAGVKLFSAALAAYRTAGLMAAAAQLGLNTAMLASPITWVAVGIGVLVAAGVLLWQNWDTVKAKASELWAKLRENPMMALVAGPIGALVAGGITLYNNWDTIKTKAGELWTTTKEKFAGIKTAVSNFVQPAINWFSSLNKKWESFKSAIANFKVPKWVSTIGSTISGAASKIGGFIQGSHATGLATVPHNGYRAELHAQESVLTANQSNALRAAGILSANSDGTPNVDLSPVATPVATVSTSASSSGSAGISVSIPIVVHGNVDNNTLSRMESTIDTKVRAVLEDIFRKKLAGLEG